MGLLKEEGQVMTDATLTAATEAFSMTTTGGKVVCFHSDGPE